MNRSICDQLDDYFLGGLSGDVAVGFREHLAGCSACRETVAEQERMDRCLRKAMREIEPIPVDLPDRICKGIRSLERRRIVLRMAGVAAAAVVLLAVGSLLLVRRQRA